MVRELLDSRNVVVRAPNALGDLVMATPCFARLAAHFGPERLSLVCLPTGAQLLEGNEWFHRIIVFDRDDRHGGFTGRRRLIGELRGHRFDLGILLPNSFGSAWQFYRAGVKRRVGYYKEGRSILLHAGREREHDKAGNFVPKYTGQYFMDLLDTIDLPPGPLTPTLPLTDEDRRAAEEFLSGLVPGSPLVIVAPGAAFGPSKLWPLERVSQVIDGLRADGAHVLLSYGPGEKATAELVQADLKDRAPTMYGLSLGVLKAVYERADLLITNDTGPRHIAVALGRPVICIMGPNDPRYSDLPTVERGEVIRQEVDCTPYRWPCQLKQCPIDHRCMTGISVERVLAAARRELAKATKS